ncbi:MAG: hypothetical protein JWQ02_2131 [Capsulimonas sp.]|nr:hypothetical protein [Capsulimonas sp.]
MMETSAAQSTNEISRPPRPARFTTRAQATRVICALVTAGAFFFVLWLGMRDLKDLHALHSQGRSMGALITNKTVHYGKTTSYRMNYEFYVNQTLVQDHSTFTYQTWSFAVVGGKLLITYLPSSPHTYRLGAITDERIARQGKAWFWGCLATLCIVGLFAGAVEWTFQEQLALMRDGVAVYGTVMGRETVPSEDPRYKNSMPLCYVSYTIPVGPPGRIYKVQTTWSALYDLDITQRLPVLCDPQRPWRNRPLFLLTGVRV